MIGVLVVSLLGVPVVLLQGGAANIGSIILSILGTVMLAAAVVFFANKGRGDSSDMYSLAP